MQRYSPRYSNFGHPSPDNLGDYVLYTEAQAEIDALHAECDRLTAMLCKVPTKEAEAAYDQIDRYLRNNLDDSEYADMSAALEHCYRTLLYPQKPMSAEEVMEPGFYWWKFADHRWVIVIARYDDSKIVIKTVLGDEIFIGKFIGPIKMPEA